MKKLENDCVGCDNHCERCGRDKTEHIYCDICNEEIYDDYFTEDGRDICKECYIDHSDDVKELLTLDNAMIYGAEGKEPVKLNHFLYMMYDEDEIEELLLRDLRQLSEAEQKAKVAKYISEGSGGDWWEFIECLDARGNKDARAIIESEVIYGDEED